MEVIAVGYLEAFNIEDVNRLNHGMHRVIVLKVLIKVAVAALIGMGAGPETDPGRKIHAGIVEWGELSVNEREKDRQMVRAIPRILALAGYAIAPVEDRA